MRGGGAAPRRVGAAGEGEAVIVAFLVGIVVGACIVVSVLGVLLVIERAGS